MICNFLNSNPADDSLAISEYNGNTNNVEKMVWYFTYTAAESQIEFCIRSFKTIPVCCRIRGPLLFLMWLFPFGKSLRCISVSQYKLSWIEIRCLPESWQSSWVLSPESWVLSPESWVVTHCWWDGETVRRWEVRPLLRNSHRHFWTLYHYYLQGQK